MSSSIEALAEGIHETWRALSKAEGWTMEPRYDKPYDELGEIEKDDNRAAGQRIPEILAMIGLGVDGTDAPHALSDGEVRGALEHHMERLAEAEHDGWMEHRFRTGWRQGEPRNDSLKIHPLLVPYARLSDKERKKDRNAVRHFPDMVARGGLRVVRLDGARQGSLSAGTT